MSKIAEERTIVLIVDELDRCIPQYAIKVLERLHHLFYGLENIVVIMAIDRRQLEHSVEEMFGMRRAEEEKEHKKDFMDIERYLKKFIDFSMVLDYGNVNDKYQEKYLFYFERFLIKEEDRAFLAYFLPPLIKGIDIRRIEKMIDKANIVHSITCKDTVDISVLAFEMLYEILKYFEVKNMECVVFADEKEYTDFAAIGEERVSLFKWLRKRSRLPYGNVFYDNFCGRVLWYFVSIFYRDAFLGEMAYDFPDFENKYNQELKIAQKYCGFREIIK